VIATATIEVSEALGSARPSDPSLAPAERPQSGGVERLGELLPSGYTWVVSSPLASGCTVAFRYALSAADGTPGAHGIGLCEFAGPRPLFSLGKAPPIRRLRLFVSGDAPL
jgi:hypothetical protein